jgi:ATP-dependent protease ClpP protease subunit
MPNVLRRVVVVALLKLAGCQPPPQVPPTPEASVIGSTAYLIFNAPVVPASGDLFIADIDKFRNAGARDIDLGINSPGGDIDAAQGIVDYMTRQHDQNGITFNIYNVGLVASAATYIFLHAQNRYSQERSAFLFHAAGAVSNGPVSAEKLREQADKLDAYERLMRATLKERSKLTDSEAQTYVRRTVVLNADDARRDGIIDGIAAYPSPKGAKVLVIGVKPGQPPQGPRPAGSPPQPGP